MNARALTVLAATAASIGLPVATASAATNPVNSHWDSTRTLQSQQDVFIQGGDDLGRGAGEVVSAAYIGGPQGILDIPAQLAGIPEPLQHNMASAQPDNDTVTP